MNKLFLDRDGIVDFINEAVYGVLCEISDALNSNYIYHFTTFKNALKIM